ncbi:AraC family transcriptional regulator [Actibacterium sp. MT2.3-13A]|uniref:helix-turn-helix transcriptional regulator n=1 Tax=Actibacterium sp. MT2.3-13A TaxID=2828332 RepID=UPI001BA97692|nr:AraC family transcriptional regulator [Actibacterium sp. MT2.3-13A]
MLIERTNMPKNTTDRLSALIRHFRIEAKVFPAARSGLQKEGPGDAAPNLFIFRHGRLTWPGQGMPEGGANPPMLVFFPRGTPAGAHVEPDVNGAEYVCAAVDTVGDDNPVAQALPEVVVVRRDEVSSLQSVTDMLLEEAFSPRCGGQAVIDRLCEIAVIRLLRHLIEDGEAKVGLIAGLAHPNLSRAIVAIHDNPERNWRLEDLAGMAAMSRTHFANRFREVVGVTPGEYLSSWRLTLARIAIAKGASVNAAAMQTGFSCSAALSRAFTRRYGVSPRQFAKPGPTSTSEHTRNTTF